MECRVCIDFSWVIHRSYHAHRTLSANIDGKEVGTGDILFKKRTQNRILGVTHAGDVEVGRIAAVHVHSLWSRCMDITRKDTAYRFSNVV
jgi:hypothetical protein